MGLAKDGIVDFLADTIEHSYVIIAVFGASMTLDGFVAFGTDLV